MKRRKYLPVCARSLTCALLLVALAVPLTSCEGRTPATGDVVYELRLSHHIPPSAPPAKAIERWAEKVEEATEGRVRFTIYPAETLAKGREALRATEDGVCDVAVINLAFVADQWSLNSVVALESVAMPSGKGAQIWDALLERFPEMAAELSSVKVLGKSVATSTSLHVKGVEVRVPADLVDLKIAALGDSVSFVRAAGAISVNVSSNDWAVAANKGLIVGCMAPVYVVTDRGLEQIFDHHLDLGMGGSASALVMNWNAWDGLPADVREIIDGFTPWVSEAMSRAAEEVEQEGWEKCQGQTVVVPTEQEVALWKACFQPTVDQWVEDSAGEGPSREIYDYLIRLAEQ